MIWVSDFYKQLFHTKVYKLSLDVGCTCPNRDGTKGNGGCIFCSQAGSGDFASSRTISIEQQIEQAKKLVEKKARGRSGSITPLYIAYFQNFTNTYGDSSYLLDLYKRAAACKDIVGIAIATRPDCLGDDILDGIAQLCDQTFVSIEFGLQTCNDEIANKINRCYPTAVYDQAIKRIKKADSRIHIVTHIIFGLPDESDTDMLTTLKYAINVGTDGIKIAVLHILEGTWLAEQYKQGLIDCMTQDHYYMLLKQALSVLPEKMVVHRLTGDGPKRILLAPLWTANKRKVHNDILYLIKNSHFN